jgi:hypothetical protein
MQKVFQCVIRNDMKVDGESTIRILYVVHFINDIQPAVKPDGWMGRVSIIQSLA